MVLMEQEGQILRYVLIVWIDSMDFIEVVIIYFWSGTS